MELSIHQVAKQLGKVFTYTWRGKLADQVYGGRTVRFVGDVILNGTVLGDAEGFTVTGSDSRRSRLTEQLETQGAVISCPQSADNIRDELDVVVYTAAVHPDNPEFAEALSAADHVVLAPIYAAREKDIYGVSSDNVAEEIAKLGTDVRSFGTFKEIEEYVRAQCSDGDLLITMGAGNVTNIGPELID